jgi:hypothetical protein
VERLHLKQSINPFKDMGFQNKSNLKLCRKCTFQHLTSHDRICRA